MGLFGNKKASDELVNRLRILEQTCDSLQRESKSLRLEWEELYDKVRHQMSRMSKRVSSDKKFNGELPPPPDTQDGVPELDPISKSIMLRRARQSLPRKS